jgi:hypothetical protein
LESGDPLAVEFAVADINVLSDVTQLRVLKLSQVFPVEFEISKDVFDCANRIIRGDSLYRVLEFCMLRNRVLVHYVTEVFPVLKRSK